MGRLLAWIKVEPLLAVVLWGAVYPGAKLGLREIPATSFAALRLLVASAILTALSRSRGRLGLPRDLRRQALCAALAQTAFQVLLIAGLRRTTAGNSAVLLATAPLLTAAAVALRRRELPARRHTAGLFLGIAGVALVIRGGAGAADPSDPLGDAIAVAAAAAWAWYGLSIGPLVRRLGTWWATGVTMLTATLVVTPAAVPEWTRIPWNAISWGAWAGLIYGATLGMVVAMALWGRSVSRLGPRETMVYVYLEPVSAVVIAAVLLGESFGLGQALGGALTLVAVWITSAPGARGAATSEA